VQYTIKIFNTSLQVFKIIKKADDSTIRIFNLLGNMLYVIEDEENGHSHPITKLLTAGPDYLISGIF
jgi:hypothetical protein